jgi:hypothetical protein
VPGRSSGAGLRAVTTWTRSGPNPSLPATPADHGGE